MDQFRGAQPSRTDLDSVLDILRNEKKVSLLFSGTGPGNENGILTGEERLGEAIPKAA